MNFTNKKFYERIGNLDSKALQNIRKGVINKSTITVDPNKVINAKENHSIAKFSANEVDFLNITKPKPSIETNRQNPKAAGSSTPGPAAVGVAENRSSFNNTTSSDSYVVTVITKGRGYAENEIGIASIDVNSPILYLSQFSDEFWYNGFITKLNLLQPSEIILPYTVYNSESKIVNAIKEHFARVKLIPLPRRHFSTEDGMNMINELCSSECKSLIKFIEKRYYTVVAVSALLKYLKQILMINFVPGGLKIEYQAKCGRMLIDHDTCHRLELLYPLCRTVERKSCLFGILDYTVTTIGKRQLRAKILEPFNNPEQILQTQECIKELIEDTELLFVLEETLRKFWNVDKILKLVVVESEDNKTKSVELMFDKILLLKSILDNIPELADCLRCCKSLNFKQIYRVLMDERYSVMLSTINDIIRPEAQFSRGTAQLFNRIQAIQEGVNEVLDFTRGMYTKLTDEIRDTIKEIALQNELPLRMMYMATKGFYMQLMIPKNNQNIALPSNINVFHRKGNVMYLTNPDLVKLNVRITDVVNEIYEISDRILRELIAKLTQYIDANHYLIGIVSNLDIIQSYAKTSMKDSYCCPKFGDETRVIDAVHPLLEHSKSKAIIVPNNIISTPEYNVFFVTGPNMGGKTIYIKMIAILQIMAQLGCFVPATKATFKLCDRIFTRIGYEDSTEQGGSSFQVELREIEYILKNITPNSLVIVDELCRSTNPTDGKRISQQICERFCRLNGLKYYEESSIDDDSLVNKSTSLFKSERNEKIVNLTAPFIFITTHYLHLTKLSEKYLNVSNLHVEAKEKYSRGILSLEYNHKIKEGVTPIKGYGISLAHSVNFNESIISRAYEILNDYATNIEETKSSSNTSYYFDKVFENFEKTLNQTSNTFVIENNLNNTLISNFMNNPDDKSNETNSFLQNIPTKQLLRDVQSKLYDLYAGIAEIFRNKNSEDENTTEPISINEKITSLLNNLIMNLPEPLLAEILKDANNSIRNSKVNPTGKQDNKSSSLSSVKRDSNIEKKDDTKSNDSNVNWSKLYPEMSLHSFLRKLDNGNITLPSTLPKSHHTVSRDKTSSHSEKIQILENVIVKPKISMNPDRSQCCVEEEQEYSVKNVLNLSTNKSNPNIEIVSNEEQKDQGNMQLRNKKIVSKNTRNSYMKIQRCRTSEMTKGDEKEGEK